MDICMTESQGTAEEHLGRHTVANIVAIKCAQIVGANGDPITE